MQQAQKAGYSRVMRETTKPRRLPPPAEAMGLRRNGTATTTSARPTWSKR